VSCLSGFTTSPEFLIPKGSIKGWKAVGEPEIYKGKDLFLYMDGGAKIYHEYGFRNVVVQKFENEKGESITLEIYEMENPDAAFGMYTMKTSSEGRKLSIGKQAKLEDYYLNVYKGRFLLTLTGFDASESTQQGLVALAEQVEIKIEDEGSLPSLCSLLPKEGLVADSIKYFRGPISFLNSQTFLPSRFFVRAGTRGDYVAGYSLFILTYNSAQEAMIQWGNLIKAFQDNSSYQNLRLVGDCQIQVSHRKGVAIKAFRKRSYIIIAEGGQTAVEELIMESILE